MTDIAKYKITITATGEVRDKDGNLIETVPIEESIELTRDELDEFLDSRTKE